ncbi:MAG TPA: NADP-dependent oxidoreductase [Candidatus Sulfotelmatobacter sp.]|nr:NADP-dependent oxidoreductase [Candidatus Sulfotelmatobacter sp.]
MNQINRRITLASRPDGYPGEANFKLVEAPVPSPGPGQVLVRALYLSLDPYMRGRMSDAKSYAAPVPIGGVMEGAIVGRVIASENPKFPVGTMVEGRLGWQDYGLSDGRNIRAVDPKAGPLSYSLGVLGMPGLTAYFGLLDVCRPHAGDTVVVSAASGAVGQVVGQIAKIMDCRVVGIAGGAQKVDYVTRELGFDAGIDYKSGDLAAGLAKACPDGVDCYFDNVGGKVSDAVFANLAYRARIAICGQIALYNVDTPEPGTRNLRFMLVNRAVMEGFLVSDFTDRWPMGLKRLSRWVREGRIKYREDVVQGLENAPKAFLRLFDGSNFGKLVVKIADE